VDGDGIPLYLKISWQKAQFLDQVYGTSPRITSTRIGCMLFRGNTSQMNLMLVLGPKTPPSVDKSGGVLLNNIGISYFRHNLLLTKNLFFGGELWLT